MLLNVQCHQERTVRCHLVTPMRMEIKRPTSSWCPCTRLSLVQCRNTAGAVCQDTMRGLTRHHKGFLIRPNATWGPIGAEAVKCHIATAISSFHGTGWHQKAQGDGNHLVQRAHCCCCCKNELCSLKRVFFLHSTDHRTCCLDMLQSSFFQKQNGLERWIGTVLKTGSVSTCITFWWLLGYYKVR